ncbi:MAG: class I SAM-dependent DNA methyltransferase [Hyphomicrobiales bacterium]
MPAPENDWLDKVYSATTEAELIEGYDVWAEHYDADLISFGYKIPAIVSGFFGRYVAPSETPILDAGAGTGLITEGLRYLGYGGVTGIDLSDGMLAVARRKGIYDALMKMRLGDRLDFDDDAFAATVCAGTLTAGHVQADAFDELIRVTRPAGHVVFSVRVDSGFGDSYLARQDALEAEGRWTPRDRTDAIRSMPAGEPDVLHKVFVYEVR